MPKRRLTAKRMAQIHTWQSAGARTNARRSFSKPSYRAVRGSWGHVRRHKLGGKAYQKKAGGFTVNPEVAKVLGHG